MHILVFTNNTLRNSPPIVQIDVGKVSPGRLWVQLIFLRHKIVMTTTQTGFG